MAIPVGSESVEEGVPSVTKVTACVTKVTAFVANAKHMFSWRQLTWRLSVPTAGLMFNLQAHNEKNCDHSEMAKNSK